MTETSSKSKLNPVLLGVVGVLVLAAAGFGLSRLGEDSGGDKAGGSGGSKGKSSKGSDRHGQYAPGDPRHSAKSEDKSEAERIAGEPWTVLKDGEELQELMVRVSVSARTELKDLRDRSKTLYDDPEERREFGAKLSAVKDPAERKEMLQERTAAMRAARAQADALKPSADIEREKQLIALMQVQNLWRMAEFVRKNPALSDEADAFNQKLATWVQRADALGNEQFHTEFNELRNDLNALRKRNGAGGRTVPDQYKPGQYPQTPQ